MSTFVPRDYWEARLRTNWSLEGVGYMRLGAHFNRWLYRVQTRIFRRHVPPLRHDWATVDVLDIGSGTGHYVRLWQRLGVRSVTAADLTDVVVDSLRASLGVECHRLDIGEPLPASLQGRTFDLVSTFAVLYHIMDDERYEQAIRNIAALIRPGGLLVFTENFVHGPTERFPNFVARRLEDVERMLAANHLRVVKRAPMFVLMNAPLDTRGRLWRTLWRSAMAPVRRFNVLGRIAGPLCYLPELLLTRVMRDGPSTELMVCERMP